MSRVIGLVLVAALMALVAAFPARAQVQEPPKTPTAVGTGGSAATVDPLATQAAIDVLRKGGNAVDAAVAAAGVLGVVEPFSCGIGGGGFMVIYDARHRRVDTIDSRETAPAGLHEGDFSQWDSANMAQFTEARVGGLSVGVPGTVRGWEAALQRYGTKRLSSLLRPAEKIARKGWKIDATFNSQVDTNKEIFDDFTPSRELYLTDADTAKPVGSTQRNPDIARTYERIGKDPDTFYEGRIARDIAQAVQHPPVSPDSDRPHTIHPGSMTPNDLARYAAIRRDPTRIGYRGLDIYGMAPPSSGGTTVGEALNIMEGFSPLGSSREEALHRYLEASKLAYADRGKYVGDPAYVKPSVPVRGLLSDGFAAERRAKIGETALSAPQDPGDPWPYNGGGDGGSGKVSSDDEGPSTTHLTVADRWGNVVTYTFTIEQIGGSGITVPGRGFLLNNELTDFNFATGTANSPAPGKRPRSSMSPTLVFHHGRPALALGSPGGSTIITTVLQIIVNSVDFKMSLPDAIAAPRASQRNSATSDAEPAFLASPEAAALQKRGHAFKEVAEIGVATGIRFLHRGRQQAAAEPTRRGGGSAMVVRP
jgi:gamma-glutamyltranspeptidase / glutathione hydrolase